MKKLLLVCSLTLVLLCLGMTAHAANVTKIDVLYMNHGPLMDTLTKMKSLFAGYGNQVTVFWHDFESEEGEQFMAKMGIRQHVPLIIWIDGTPTQTVGAKQVTFSGFPTGAGPASFQGKWTIDDLKAALHQATTKK